MTNEQLKQEAIKKAYGEYWEILPDKDKVLIRGCIELNTYLNLGLKFDKVFLTENLVRPKSLAGIETNNCWIRIEKDGSNLPTHLLWLSDLRTVWQGCLFIDFDNQNIRINTAATHYQQIIKPEAPIY